MCFLLLIIVKNSRFFVFLGFENLLLHLMHQLLIVKVVVNNFVDF